MRLCPPWGESHKRKYEKKLPRAFSGRNFLSPHRVEDCLSRENRLWVETMGLFSGPSGGGPLVCLWLFDYHGSPLFRGGVSEPYCFSGPEVFISPRLTKMIK